MSLTKCLKANGRISAEDAEFIKESASYYERDGKKASEAAVLAVTDTIELAGEQRAKLMDRIEFAGGIIPSEPGTVADEASYDDIPFRRKASLAPSLPVADVVKYKDNLVADWKGAPNMTTVQSESELPDYIQSKIKKDKAEGEVKAIYDNGQVFLVADNIRHERDVVESVLHEVRGHHAMREFFGKDMDLFLADVWRTYRGEKLHDVAQQYGIDLRTRNGKLLAAEEYLAVMVEKGDPAGGIVSRFVTWVKERLQAMGFSGEWVSNLTEKDIANMVSRAGKEIVDKGKYRAPRNAYERNEELTKRMEAEVAKWGEAAVHSRELSKFDRKGGPFYSKLEREMNKLPGKGTVQSYKDTINAWLKSGKFKAEELEWSGLMEWLDEAEAASTGGVQYQIQARRHEGKWESISTAGTTMAEAEAKATSLNNENTQPTLEYRAFEFKPTDKVTKAEVMEYLQENLLTVEAVPYGDGDGSFWGADLEFTDSEPLDDWQAEQMIEQLVEGGVHEHDARERVEEYARDEAVDRDEVIESVAEEYGITDIVDQADWDNYDFTDAPVDPADFANNVEEAYERAIESYVDENYEEEMRQIAEYIVNESGEYSNERYYTSIAEGWTAEASGNDEMGYSVTVSNDEGDYIDIGSADGVGQADDMINEWAADNESELGGGTKWRQYTVDGGDEYTELLFHIPDEKVDGEFEYDSHWENGKKNFIAHARFKTRHTAEGKRVLFLEEVQSDWHFEGEQGGYEGYMSPADEKEFRDSLTLDEKEGVLIGDMGNRYGVDFDGGPNGMSLEEAIEAAKDAAVQSERDSGSVPNAPFKKNWRDVAIKQMVRYAVDNGFDAIAITPGRVHAERWGTEAIAWTSGNTFVERRSEEDRERIVELADLIAEAEGKETALDLEISNAFFAGEPSPKGLLMQRDVERGKLNSYRMRKEEAEYGAQAASELGNLMFLENDLARIREMRDMMLGGYSRKHILDFDPAYQHQSLQEITSPDKADARADQRRELILQARKKHEAARANLQELKPGQFAVTVDQQRGGQAGNINLEAQGEAEGLVQNNRKTIVTSEAELLNAIKSRFTGGRKAHKLAAKMWKRMQEEPKGVVKPRAEGLMYGYDTVLPKALAKWTGGKVEMQKVDQHTGTVPYVEITDKVTAKAEAGYPLFRRVKRDRNLTKLTDMEKQGVERSVMDRLRSGRNKIRYEVVNKFAPLVDRQKDIENETGTKIPESQDAVLAATVYPGKVRARVDEFHDNYFEPMLDLIENSEHSLTEVEDYLHARHAREANAYLRKINPDRPNNNALSGMEDKRAKEILHKYRGDDAMQNIGTFVDNMNNAKLEMAVQEGLITQDEVDQWKGQYKHYVPLRREEKDALLPGRGSGFTSTTPLSRVRVGSEKEVANILPYMIEQAEATIVLAEKAAVGRAMHELVTANPDENYWVMDKQEKIGSLKTNPEYKRLQLERKRLLNSDLLSQDQRDARLVDLDQQLLDTAAKIAAFNNDPTASRKDNVFAYKIDGVNHTITFNADNVHAMRTAAALNNHNAAEMGTFVKAMSRVSRFLSNINTTLNPEFVITNFTRDIQTAVYNLSDTEADGLQKQIVKDVYKSGKGLYQYFFKNDRDSEWAKYVQEFRSAGGQVAWLDNYKDINDRRDHLIARLKEDTGGVYWKSKKNVKAFIKRVEDMNMVVENAVRVSAFVNARKAGVSEAKAARLARELTVDFNRKGASGTLMNSMYLFFNASVQGNARLLRAMVHSKKTQRLATATIGAAFVIDVFNRSFGGEDEEGNSLYDTQVSEATKERNLVLMIGGEPYTIPLPWGYNVLHSIGRTMAEATTKEDWKAMDSASAVTRAITGAFNPVGSDSTLGQFVAPTVIDPVLQISENVSAFGTPVMPANRFKEIPDHMRHWSSVRETSKGIATSIAEWTGGNDAKAGLIDFSPESVDLWIDFWTGGVGRLVSNTIDVGQGLATEGTEGVKQSRIPFARKVAPGLSDRALQSSFYDRIGEVNTLNDQLKTYKDNPDMMSKLREENLELYRLRPFAKSLDKQIRKLRKERRQLVASGASDADKKAGEDRIEAQLQVLYKKFVKKYNDQFSE